MCSNICNIMAHSIRLSSISWGRKIETHFKIYFFRCNMCKYSEYTHNMNINTALSIIMYINKILSLEGSFATLYC